jgi:hypothetical protein
VSVYIDCPFFYALSNIDNLAGKPPIPFALTPNDRSDKMADPTAEEIAAQKEREEVSGEIFDGKQESFASKEEEPLAGIDPTLLKTINNLASKVEGLSNFGERLKQTENRIGALSNKEAAAKKRFDELEEKKRLEQERVVTAEHDEAWEEYSKEFPDMAKAVEGRIRNRDKTINQLRSELEAVKARKVENPANFEIRLLTMAHPDWRTVKDSPEYSTWLKTQPDDVRKKALYGQTADDGAEIMTMFKSRKIQKTPEQIAAERQRRLEGSINHSSRHKQKKLKSEADMSDAELRESVSQEVFG